MEGLPPTTKGDQRSCANIILMMRSKANCSRPVAKIVFTYERHDKEKQLTVLCMPYGILGHIPH